MDYSEERKDDIFEELEALGVPALLMNELKLSMVVDRSLTFCCVVNKFIHEFNCADEIESQVVRLLQSLAWLHFKH